MIITITEAVMPTPTVEELHQRESPEEHRTKELFVEMKLEVPNFLYDELQLLQSEYGLDLDEALVDALERSIADGFLLKAAAGCEYDAHDPERDIVKADDGKPICRRCAVMRE